MISRFIYLTVSLGVCSAAWAEDSAAEVKTAGYHLKNQSSFQAAPGTRAPFWPIGWAPVAAGITQTDAAPVATITPDQFTVTSIMLGSPSIAIINGRPCEEGKDLKQARVSKAIGEALPAAGPAKPLPPGIRVHLNRVLDGQVILQSGNQAIAVPLRRPQLSDRKSGDEDLLSSSDR